jgi:uncharacterized protein (DUF433 family)
MKKLAQFTAAEAAYVLEEPVRMVKKALDAGPVRSTLVRRPGGSVRAIEWSDLFYLFAVRTLQEELTPKARVEFYEAVRRRPLERGREVQFGRIRVAVADFFDEVEKRTRKLSELYDKVEFRSDGEPLLKGTDIEAYRVAALLDGGITVDAVLADYPSLSRDAVEPAKACADTHPKAGRPYPRTTAKRALRGAGLEALDQAPGDDDSSE